MAAGGMGGALMSADETRTFLIPVAAELAGMHPQTLRQYDRLGLVSPGRAPGRGRRYSLRDVAKLREVQRLSQEEGINLAGIKRILALEGEVERLTEQVDALRMLADPGRRVFTAGPEGEVVVARTWAEFYPRTRGKPPCAAQSAALADVSGPVRRTAAPKASHVCLRRRRCS